MKLTRCMHNHYYDGSKHTKCPQCIAKGLISSDDAKIEEKNKEPEIMPVVSIHPPIVNQQSLGYGNSDTKTTDLINGGEPSPIVFFKQDNKNIDAVAEDSEQDITKDTKTDIQTQDELPEIKVAKKSPEKSPLQEEISSARHVVGQDSKTVAFYDIESTEPVVGWLVALNGAYIGESFCLKTGRNNIGRWTKMDVALPQEASVSRDRHAILTFDPSGRKFYIQSGEGNALVYLNDELLLVPSTIQEGDIVKLGECRLLFKPLCGESFTWDTYLKGNK